MFGYGGERNNYNNSYYASLSRSGEESVSWEGLLAHAISLSISLSRPLCPYLPREVVHLFIARIRLLLGDMIFKYFSSLLSFFALRTGFLIYGIIDSSSAVCVYNIALGCHKLESSAF